jgi:two-component system cell cycle response regulator
LRLWIADGREHARIWFARVLADAGHGIDWVGAPEEVADLPGEPDALVVGTGGHQAGPWLQAVRTAHPELPLVVWEDAEPLPRLAPPLERVLPSHDGSGLCEAVERCRPWAWLRAERDGARTQAAEALSRAELSAGPALRDPDSSAYNLAYFTDYASKEIDKARRYGRGFSLIVFGLDGLLHLRARAGADQARAVVRSCIRALTRVLRESDVLAKMAEQEFLLLLPETDAFGAQVFLRRALASVRDSAELRAVEQISPVLLQGGASSFPSDGEEFDILLNACRSRLEQRRASLQRRLLLDPLGFWEAVELLLGTPDGPRLPVEDGGDPSRRGRIPEPLFDEVQTEIGRTLLRDPGSRSLVYLAGPEAGPALPLVRALERAGADFLPRIYLLGRRTEIPGRPGLTPVSLAGDEHLVRHEFLLWLHGASAYALLQRRGRGATWAFHTSDAALVDGLVSKLQAAYDLQPY